MFAKIPLAQYAVSLINAPFPKIEWQHVVTA
jgi:hypothetical protein